MVNKCFGCLGGGDSPQRESTQEAAQDPPQEEILVNHPCSSLGTTFEWLDIFNGTKNFRESNLLGECDSGRVYRCDLPRDNAVGAVKIQRYSNLVNSHALLEFEAEIRALHRANDHPNVIRLLGKFMGKEKLCVVYEYMPNSSLDHHLFEQARRRGQQEVPCLTWNRRMRIALGVAKALVYLHNELKLVHRDVKSSNVLLDENFVAKLTDFGLASTIFVGEDGVDRAFVVTPNKGAKGFIAPETHQTGFVSTKSDVYSYGILLLELLTGKKAYDTDRPLAKANITDWLSSVRYSKDDMSRLVDVRLGNRYSLEGFKRLFQAANMCIAHLASARPNMNAVEKMVREALPHRFTETATTST